MLGPNFVQNVLIEGFLFPITKWQLVPTFSQTQRSNLVEDTSTISNDVPIIAGVGLCFRVSMARRFLSKDSTTESSDKQITKKITLVDIVNCWCFFCKHWNSNDFCVSVWSNNFKLSIAVCPSSLLDLPVVSLLSGCLAQQFENSELALRLTQQL